GARLQCTLTELPAQPREYLVLDAHVRLSDRRELEPAIAHEPCEALRELDFAARGEVIEVVCGAESQHAGRVETTADYRDFIAGAEERKHVACVCAEGDGKDVCFTDRGQT